MFIYTHATGGPGVPFSEATLIAQAQAGCAEYLNQLMARHEVWSRLSCASRCWAICPSAFTTNLS
jgi:hypothetical protein